MLVSSANNARSRHKTRWILKPFSRRTSCESLLFVPGQCTIGSSADCTLTLSLRGVSETHCTVFVENGIVRLQAHDARTWLNDLPIRDGELRVGDRLVIGPVEFRIREATTEEWSSAESADDAPSQVTPATDALSSPPRSIDSVRGDINRRQDQIAELLSELDESDDQSASDNSHAADELSGRIEQAKRQEALVRDLLLMLKQHADELRNRERNWSEEKQRQCKKLETEQTEMSRRQEELLKHERSFEEDARRLSENRRELDENVRDWRERQQAESLRSVSERESIARQRNDANLTVAALNQRFMRLTDHESKLAERERRQSENEQQQKRRLEEWETYRSQLEQENRDRSRLHRQMQDELARDRNEYILQLAFTRDDNQRTIEHHGQVEPSAREKSLRRHRETLARHVNAVSIESAMVREATVRVRNERSQLEKIAEAQRQLDSRERQISDVEQQLREEMQSLRDEAEELRLEKSALADAQRAVQQEREALEEALEEALKNRQIDSSSRPAEGELGEIHHQRKLLDQSVREAAFNLIELQDRLQVEQDIDCAYLERERERLDDVEDDLHRESVRIEQHAAELDDEVEECAERLAESRTQIANAKSQLDTYQKKLKKERKRIDSLQENLRSQNEELTKEKQDLEEARQRFDAEQKEFETARERWENDHEMAPSPTVIMELQTAENPSSSDFAWGVDADWEPEEIDEEERIEVDESATIDVDAVIKHIAGDQPKDHNDSTNGLRQSIAEMFGLPEDVRPQHPTEADRESSPEINTSDSTDDVPPASTLDNDASVDAEQMTAELFASYGETPSENPPNQRDQSQSNDQPTSDDTFLTGDLYMTDASSANSDRPCDSIAEYMEQLLARSRDDYEPGTFSASVHSSAKPTEVHPAGAKGNVSATGSSTLGGQSLDDTADKQREQRRPIDRDAVRADLTSLREVANLSARTALAKHTWKKTRSLLMLKGAMAVFAFAVAGVVLLGIVPAMSHGWSIGLAALAIGLIGSLDLAGSMFNLFKHKAIAKGVTRKLNKTPSDSATSTETETSPDQDIIDAAENVASTIESAECTSIDTTEPMET